MQEPFEPGVVGPPDGRAGRVVAERVDELGRLRHGAQREADRDGNGGDPQRPAPGERRERQDPPRRTRAPSTRARRTVARRTTPAAPMRRSRRWATAAHAPRTTTTRIAWATVRTPAVAPPAPTSRPARFGALRGVTRLSCSPVAGRRPPKTPCTTSATPAPIATAPAAAAPRRRAPRITSGTRPSSDSLNATPATIAAPAATSQPGPPSARPRTTSATAARAQSSMSTSLCAPPRP